MEVTLLWREKPVGTCNIFISSGELAATEFFSLVSVYRQQHEGIALGFRLSREGQRLSFDLAKPVTVSIPADTVAQGSTHIPPGVIQGHIRAKLDGPGVFGRIHAHLDGPGVKGIIHADLDGPGVFGRIHAHLDGPGVIGIIHADLDGRGVFGRIRAHLDGPGVEGVIRADFDGPGVFGRIRAHLDGPGVEGIIRADFDGPGIEGYIRAESSGNLEFHSWSQALRALITFIAQRDDNYFRFIFVTFLREGVEIGAPLLSPQAERSLSEHLSPNQPLSSNARRALYQHRDYFEKLITEQPREAALALTQNLSEHMLARAPLEEDSPPRKPVRLGVCAPSSAPIDSSFL